MCNLYSVTKSQDAIRNLFRTTRDTTGNLPPMPAIFPDQLAPVVRTGRDGERQLTMMRWGFPPPPNLGTRPVTNVRNAQRPYWRAWLKAFGDAVKMLASVTYVALWPAALANDARLVAMREFLLDDGRAAQAAERLLAAQT
jgi:hypothetical protein